MIEQSAENLRILVADDEQASLELFEQLLSPNETGNAASSELDKLSERLFGNDSQKEKPTIIDLLTCQSGNQAVEAVKNSLEQDRPFAMAFLDVRMPPGPDGVRTAEKIRKMDPNIEIVIVTAYSDIKPRDIARKVPPSHKLLYIQKPFHPHEIIQFASSLGAKWQMEKKLRSINFDLEKRVEKRTNELEFLNEKLEEDIDKRKMTEKSLRESEERYRTLFERAGDAIFILEAEGEKAGNIVSANQAAAKMHGYSVDEFEGMNIKDLDTPEVSRQASARIAQLLEGKWINEEITHRKKDGTIFPVEISAGLLELGKSKYILAFDRDISKRKDAEKALKDSNLKLEKRVAQRTEELSKANKKLKIEIKERKQVEKRKSQLLKETEKILEAMPFGIIMVGLDKKIKMINDAALKMIKVNSKEDIYGKTCYTNICPAQTNACPIIDLGQNVESSEKVLLTVTGEKIPILKTVIPISIEEEPILLEAVVDITDLKRAQGALQKAKVSAEAADRAKSDFLANMSHELRTPLNHIIGFTELLKDEHFGELNDAQEDYLNDIHQSSHHLLSLINDILDLSKVEAGKLELNATDVQIKQLLENSLIMVKEKAMKHDLQIKCDCNGIPETIEADERKLKQILYNLLSNAVKFTQDNGTISLVAQAYELFLKGETNIFNDHVKGIKISITDTGIGIRPEDLKRVFDPFEQAEKSTARRFQGTGLGLALTKKLVELHGGKIWAESQGDGKGATFSFFIPI